MNLKQEPSEPETLAQFLGADDKSECDTDTDLTLLDSLSQMDVDQENEKGSTYKTKEKENEKGSTYKTKEKENEKGSTNKSKEKENEKGSTNKSKEKEMRKTPRSLRPGAARPRPNRRPDVSYSNDKDLNKKDDNIKGSAKKQDISKVAQIPDKENQDKPIEGKRKTGAKSRMSNRVEPASNSDILMAKHSSDGLPGGSKHSPAEKHSDEMLAEAYDHESRLMDGKVRRSKGNRRSSGGSPNKVSSKVKRLTNLNRDREGQHMGKHSGSKLSPKKSLHRDKESKRRCEEPVPPAVSSSHDQLVVSPRFSNVTKIPGTPTPIAQVIYGCEKFLRFFTEFIIINLSISCFKLCNAWYLKHWVYVLFIFNLLFFCFSCIYYFDVTCS